MTCWTLAIAGQVVPYPERHAGQHDELLEPGGDLRMGIVLRTQNWLRYVQSSFVYLDSLSWPNSGRTLILIMPVNGPNSRFRSLAATAQAGTVLTGTAEELMR